MKNMFTAIYIAENTSIGCALATEKRTCCIAITMQRFIIIIEIEKDEWSIMLVHQYIYTCFRSIHLCAALYICQAIRNKSAYCEKQLTILEIYIVQKNIQVEIFYHSSFNIVVVILHDSHDCYSLIR